MHPARSRVRLRRSELRPSRPPDILPSVPDTQIHLEKKKSGALIAGLLAVNAAAWVLTFVVALREIAFLGLALTAYLFGLRHAIDADHISAIDNVTRRLMHDGKRPVSAGLFFSLGHSTVVFLMAIAIAAGSQAVARGLLAQTSTFKEWAGVIGTAISVFFLFLLAIMNLGVLGEIVRAARAGKGAHEAAHDHGLPAGLLMRLFKGMFRSVDRSWKMYPVGLLFGLGFDTASEIGLLVVSSIAVTRLTLSVPVALLLPLLFTAGMSLADTTDGLAMIGAYGSALRRGARLSSYNLFVTSASILSALLIGTAELLRLAAGRLPLAGAFWSSVDRLGSGGASGYLGAAIIAVLLLSWGVSLALRRFTRSGDGTGG